MTMIPLSVPHIAGNEKKYINECIDTEWVSSVGKFVDKFEYEICRNTGSKFAVACTSGTAALQTALLIIGVLPDDEVIVPDVTFISPINVVRYLGAEPVFMDCDNFYNMDVEKTIQFIEHETEFKDGYTINKSTKKRVSAVIPVHVFGNAVNIEPLIQICEDRNIRIVEDASESLGTYYTSGKLKNRYTGTIGDIGCYSFNGNKIITTGGGGMFVTDNRDYAEKAKYITTQAKDDPVRSIHNEVGYNFRLTNIQAAMGVAQLENLERFIEIKKNNYLDYQKKIKNINGLYLSEVPNYSNNNYWMYALKVDKDKYGKSRDELMDYLSKHGVQARPLWYLNHLQKPYSDCLGYEITKAFDLWEKTLNIPCSVNLQKDEIDYVVNLLKKND